LKKTLYFILLSIAINQVTTDISFSTSKSFAMAGAVVSDPGSVGSAFYNPAGLSNLSQSELIIGNSNFYQLDFLTFNYISYINHSNDMAFTLQSLGVRSTSDNNDNWSNPNSNLSSEVSISVSQGFDLLNDKNSKLSLGYSLNYMMLDQGSSSGPSGDGSDGLEGSKISTFGIDIGVLSSLRDKIIIGAFIKNINSPSFGKGSSLQYLPRKLSIGVTYSPFEKLKTNFQIEKLLGRSDNQFRVGLEYTLNELLILRSGIQMEPNRFGVGFVYTPNKSINISFGLLTHPVLSTTSNNIDIIIKFK